VASTELGSGVDADTDTDADDTNDSDDKPVDGNLKIV
jgi:hypothetical protein